MYDLEGLNKIFTKIWFIGFILLVAISIFLQPCCIGTAYSENGQIAVGMRNAFTGDSYLFFYNSTLELQEKVKLASNGGNVPKIYFNSDYVAIENKSVSDLQLYDYDGKKADGENNNSDNMNDTAKSYYEQGITIKHKMIFGFEFFQIKNNQIKGNLYFGEFFLYKLLNALKGSAFLLVIHLKYRSEKMKYENAEVIIETEKNNQEAGISEKTAEFKKIDKSNL